MTEYNLDDRRAAVRLEFVCELWVLITTPLIYLWAANHVRALPEPAVVRIYLAVFFGLLGSIGAGVLFIGVPNLGINYYLWRGATSSFFDTLMLRSRAPECVLRVAFTLAVVVMGCIAFAFWGVLTSPWGFVTLVTGFFILHYLQHIEMARSYRPEAQPKTT